MEEALALARPALPFAIRHVPLHSVSPDLDPWALHRGSAAFDVLLLNVQSSLLLRLCMLRRVSRRRPCRLVSADLILRPPRTARQRVAARIKQFLLGEVDQFILHFKDWTGYERHYGLAGERCIYVPFKVNRRDLVDGCNARRAGTDLSDGEFVLAAGRSLRDLGTFFAAMRRLPLPGVLLDQGREVLAEHGSALPRRGLPPGMREIVDHGPESSFIEHIARARVVVIPRFREDINATGIGTYLTAMALGKCVILSHGPGATELLRDQALLVPPEDPGAMADAIHRAWEDDSLRRAVAARGRAYADSLGDEARLVRDVLRAAAEPLVRGTVPRGAQAGDRQDATF